MESSDFGERGLGNRRSGSSRKGKKSSTDKPKQPQRGLGIAELEKIRLHDQMASYLPSLHHPPYHASLNKEDVRTEMAFSASCPSSSSYPPTSPSLFPLHPNTMMGFGEVDRRTDIRCSDGQSSSTVRPFLNHTTTFLPHQWGKQTVTLPLLKQNMEDAAQKKRRHDRCHSIGSMSQNSDSSDTQELDLDLKLSF